MSSTYTNGYPVSGYASEAQLRAEFNKLKVALDDTISRTGGTGVDNNLTVDLDMTLNDILNVNTIDVKSLELDGVDYKVVLEGLVDEAEGARDAAQLSESNVTAMEATVQTLSDNFRGTYYGPAASDPLVDPLGNTSDEGDLYFNTTTNTLRLFDGSSWNLASVDPSSLGTAATYNLATNAQAIAGTANVLPDAEQVRRNHVAQVATIADLRLLEPTFDGQQASVGDEYLAGIFKHIASNSGPDDSTDTIVTISGKRWVRLQDRTLETVSAIIPNNKDATNRDIIIMGDSISHGAFALNTFKHGWARIFQRMMNAEVGSQSYGFTNLLSLGSGPTLTEDIHSVGFSGSWTGIDVDSPQASVSLAGFAMRSPGVGSSITIYLPLFQVRGGVCYIQQPGGGTFTISVNGVLAATVNTDGVLSQQEAHFNFSDNGYGSTQIVISQTVAGTVDIVGPTYYSGQVEPTVHNFSTSGRRLRNTGEAAIVSAMQRASTFILALGHNDYYDCANNSAYLAEFSQRIDWIVQYANQYSVKVIVPDFCWSADDNNPARVQLRRAASETGGRYVDLPGAIAAPGVVPSAAYLINTLKMWVDGSHPNKSGMQWVAETISRSIGLSCCSKKDALDFHDYWMPVPLKAATGVQNTIALQPSMYRKNGGTIVFSFYIQADPYNAFPVGVYSLSDGFNAKSELSGRTGSVQIATINQASGDIVSSVSVGASGVVTLNVLAAFTTDIFFTVTLPA